MLLKTITVGAEKLPIHFGMYATKLISEKLDIDFADFMAGISISKIQEQITIATVGLNEGHRAAGIDRQFEEIEIYDMMDQNPEILNQIISTYFVQCFGKGIEKFIEEFGKGIEKFIEKFDGTDEKKAERRSEMEATVAPLKEAWPQIQATAAELVGIDYRK